jgi:VWFA-related protein
MHWFLFATRLTALAFQAPATAPATPAVVAVDFQAFDADGRPVPDLSSADVTLRVGGKVRPIRDLRFVRLEGAPSTDAMRIPPPYGSNVLPDSAKPSRSVVIVIEDESLPPGGEAAMRDALGVLLGLLGPDDRAALATVPHGGLKVDFTTDHRRVRAALDSITGQAERSESADDAACRTRNTIQALTGLLDDLAGGDGPTTVLFFSTGLTGLTPMTLQTQAQAGQAQPVIGRCMILTDLFQHLGSAAEAARANFYIIPPDSSGVTQRAIEGIEHLAGATGGTRLGMATAAESALARVLRETSGYWVATFEPEPAERNGLSHRLDVKVAREAVTVRTRAGITIPAVRADVPATFAVTARDLLQQGRTFRELPLRVAGFASRLAGDTRLRVIALAESAEPAVLTSASISLVDGNGKVVAQWHAQDAELVVPQLHAAFLAAPGMYRLRVAAVDQSRRRGTADFELDASLMPAGALRLSSIVVGLSRDGRFLPRLEFGSEASAMVQFEIYGGTPGMAIGAMLDVSDAVNGNALLATRLVVEATGEPDRFIAKGTLPIGALPAGDFVVRAIVEIQGQPAGRIVRTVRKR